MASANHENGGSLLGSIRHWFKTSSENVRSRIVDVVGESKKLVQDDRRKIIHPLKVGLAITLVSLFYYFQALYDGFGPAAMWAVLTVVVIFDFSVGATLGRGLLRGLATLIGGSLGVLCHRLATFSGRIAEPIIVGICVFVLSAVVTFLRFFPRVKARYDYGLMIIILTFSLITVSGYRDDEVIEMAHKRLSTVLIGGAATVVVCVVIFPAWAGEDLHIYVATNIEKLAIFLEGFGREYFKANAQPNGNTPASLQGYKAVLHSKSIEESLVNFAKWEPGHGGFRYWHPWEHYLKIGALTRQCANLIESLNRHLNSDVQTSLEIRQEVADLCTTICLESSYALKEVATTMKTMTRSSSPYSRHLANSKIACENLKSLLETRPWQELQLLEIIPVATAAILLIEVVRCNEQIAEAVRELATLARFRSVGAAAIAPEQPSTGRAISGNLEGDHHHHHHHHHHIIIMVPGSPPE